VKLRGTLALGIVSVGLLLSDIVQRTVIALWIKVRPTRRIAVLSGWIDFMASMSTTPFSVVGGASIQLPPRVVPSGPGTLIVMNHQSLMDIPLVVKTVEGGYPRIVTRSRYNRFVPLISHMVRLYQYPVIDPTANPKDLLRSVRAMARSARDSNVPIAIFPEGTRTRDGNIGRFKTRGLTTLLKQREWTVYVFVVDGYWQVARFKDFLKGMGSIDGRIEHVATVAWTDPRADSSEFINDLRGSMIIALAAMRAESGSP
jgi:1-acyl-sn-glycerol-3-phosphate acyltransferase